MNTYIESSPRVLTEPPVVEKVADGVSRPLWSVMIPVYNCSKYLVRTLHSVLVQDPGRQHMQIEVVDDCSTDGDVESIVHTLAEGRVEYYRHPRNVGSLKNFYSCLQRSRGYVIHLLHGDDCVKKGFYKKIEQIYHDFPSAGAAYSRYDYIDDVGHVMYCQGKEMDTDGILENWLERLCERQRIQYVAMTVKREVYEKLGGFYGTEYGEDWEMWVRIAAHYPVAYTPEILAQYRRHANSISGKSFTTAKNMEDLLWVMDKINNYLPGGKRQMVRQASRRFYAHYAVKIANALWKDLREKSAVTAQVKAAWNMQKDVFLFYKILKLLTRMTLNL